jgi:hypothetical protein
MNFSNVSQAAAALPAPRDMALYFDYIYLDVDERRRFAQESHEYLIDQLQYTGQQTITTASARIDLTLNHPVKELIWVFQDARKTDCGSDTTINAGYTQPFSYDDIVNRCRLQLNGTDRFDERYGDYFWKVQPYQHHTGGTGMGSRILGATAPATTPGPIVYGSTNPINVYSFAIQPEEHQPSGTCNFSRIDKATLQLTVSVNTVRSGRTAQVRVYAVNYNVLRVMSGMGGLAYSN